MLDTRETLCIASILALAYFMQLKTGQPMMFSKRETKESFADAWIQDVLHLRGLLKKEFLLMSESDGTTETRRDIISKIDVMHQWAEAKYGPERLAELRRATDIFYARQRDGTIVVTELGNMKRTSVVV